MARKFFARADVQKMLEENALHAEVSYLDREADGSPDNWIVYWRDTANGALRADDAVHMRKITLVVVHYHKSKLDNIEPLMIDAFGVEPTSYDVKQVNTDYWGTYYSFDILTTGAW
jgi:hypothetical protein